MLEMLRVIREQEPSKPSTKLSTAKGLPTLAANQARSRRSWQSSSGGAGLDRDEGAGEGPQPPLRDGQWLRAGCPALPGR